MAVNNTNQKKKKKGGAWWLLFLVIIWAVNNLDGEKVRRFFQRLQWQFRTGRVDMRALTAAGAVVVALVALVVIVSAAAKSAKNKRFDGIKRQRGASASVSPMSGQSVQHSHDRLSGYRGEESGLDHWKKQLDGFLEAGIIDRSEYRALLERRRR